MSIMPSGVTMAIAVWFVVLSAEVMREMTFHVLGGSITVGDG
jgi:hypothetical protein